MNNQFEMLVYAHDPAINTDLSGEQIENWFSCDFIVDPVTLAKSYENPLATLAAAIMYVSADGDIYKPSLIQLADAIQVPFELLQPDTSLADIDRQVIEQTAWRLTLALTGSWRNQLRAQVFGVMSDPLDCLDGTPTDCGFREFERTGMDSNTLNKIAVN